MAENSVNGLLDSELRAASLSLQIGAVLAAHPMATAPILRDMMRRETYTVESRALGVDDDQAAIVLREVEAELDAARAAGLSVIDHEWADPNPYRIARNRLCEGPGFRPPAELRDMARQQLAREGYSVHPEFVDQRARDLERLMEAYGPKGSSKPA